MIQHPAILSLLVTSAITSLMMLFAGWKGFLILRNWNLKSGTELQLHLERSTYLISTILAYILFFHLVSLFLYIFMADRLHTFFVGAMCAAGSLNANSFGYPVLILKILTCVCAGVWLIINHLDSQGYDYPLIRPKYLLLLTLAPLVVAETILQFFYFGRLKAQVITSCCGSLFSTGAGTLASDLSALPRVPMEVALLAAIVITTLSGISFWLRGKGGYFFAGVSAMTGVIALAALVSFVSIYVYELPTHHCPFCILHREYGFVGYPLYATLLVAWIAGISTGALMPALKHASLSRIAPDMQRKLAITSVTLYLIFGLIVLYQISSSALKF